MHIKACYMEPNLSSVMMKDPRCVCAHYLPNTWSLGTQRKQENGIEWAAT